MKKKKVTNAKPRNAMNLLKRLLSCNLPKGSFYMAKNYWFASLNQFIGVDEINVLNGKVDPVVIPYVIYSLNPEIAQALNDRYGLTGESGPDIPNCGFAVVANKNNLALASFDELSQAKAYIQCISPNVKAVRASNLGVNFEKLTYSDLPSVAAELTCQDWIDYFLNKENDYSYDAAIDIDGVYAMLKKLVEHGGPQRILNDFWSFDDLSNAIAYTETHQLDSYKMGFEVAFDFEFKHSRFELGCVDIRELNHQHAVGTIGEECYEHKQLSA